jgi:hypothetical protein
MRNVARGACHHGPMPSHFSSIGFDVTSMETFGQMVEKILPAAVPIQTSRGTYHRWTSKSGAEVWVQVNRRSEVIEAHPHFAGSSQSSIMVDQLIHRANQTELDGSLHGWMNGTAADGDDGDYPLVVDCANYCEFLSEPPPALAIVQLTAFAYEWTAFDSVEAFDAAQRDEEVHFASRSFIPEGVFGDDVAEAQAFFCGHVLAAEERTNEVTGRAFYWAQVETYGTTLDVVMDPQTSDCPKIGGVIKGTFWLSSHIKTMSSQAGFVRRMLWRLRS